MLAKKPPPSLKHFVLQVEARKLYRDVLRALKGVDSATAAGVREAARAQFKDNEDQHDLEKIRCLLVDGRHSLDQMRGYFGTALRR